jgi:predicted dehydrogenase
MGMNKKDSLMTEKQCNVAIVGAGYMAREHIRAFQDIENVRITGIMSRTRGRAEALAREFHIPTVYDSISELYEKTKADLVVVSVPELEANRVSGECFEHPWTIMMEKPAGYNLDDAEEIAGVAKERGKRVFVALNRRFYSSTRAALTDLEGNASPRFIHLQDQEDTKRALEAGQPKLVVENWMYANSIHVIDYFCMFGRGGVVAVEPIIPWQGEGTRIIAAKVQFDSGDVGLYQGIWNEPGPWSATINTPEKRWEIRPLEQAAFQLAGQRKPEPVAVHAWDQEFKPGLRLQAQEAVRAALDEETNLPTLEDGLKTMRLVKDIYRNE